MSRFSRSALAAVLAVSAACARRRSGADAKAEILRVDAEWAAAAVSRDLDRAVSYWSDDARVFPPGGPPLVGKAAIREYVARSLQTPGFAISWKTDDVVVSDDGNFAYATGTNRVSFTGPDGKPLAVDGKAITVWRREPAGGWKCVIDIWNDVSPAKP